MPKGREPQVYLPLTLLKHLLNRALIYVPVHLGLYPAHLAKELVYRYTKGFPLDMPQGDVDGRDGRINSQAQDVAKAVHDFPLMLDVQCPLTCI